MLHVGIHLCQELADGSHDLIELFDHTRITACNRFQPVFQVTEQHFKRVFTHSRYCLNESC
ncbi:hypothetical protein D3C87_2190240 [compost metagenome]